MLALVLAFLGTLGLASPASAHNASLAAVAECQADGTYLVTYTVTWKSVPAKAIGSPIVARTDTDGTHDDAWQDDPDAFTWTDRGTVTSAEGSTSWSETLPGDTAGRWAYSWVKWTNSYQGDRFQETQIQGLGGDCEGPAPTPVTVNANFGDNACVDGVYTEPTLTAPDVAGTTREVTGTVAPGETVTVVYTAQDGYVIEGDDTFTHLYPVTPASDADCPDVAGEQAVAVDAGFADNACVDGAYTEPTLTAPDVAGTTREVTGTVAPGEAVTVVYSAETGYTIEGRSTFSHTYPANPASDADCPDVAGEQQEQPEQPQTATPDTPEVAGVQATVPTAVDAGLAAAPATVTGLPGWLTTVLGGVLLVGLGGLLRIRSLRRD